MKNNIYLVLFLFAVSISMVQGQTAYLSFNSQPLQINDIQPVEVLLQINDVNNLFGGSIVLQYDKQIINITDVQQGSLLIDNPANEGVFFEYSPALNIQADTMQIDQSILGSSTVSGSGTFIRLKIAAKKSGSTTLGIKSIRMRDNENNIIDVNSTNLTINILLPMVKPKVLLQGGYNSSTNKMNVNLLSVLPTAQPFNIAPFNYNGTENVAASFFQQHTNIVDWVLLELRTDISSSSIISRRAGFLLESGEIVDMDGTNPIYFGSVTPENYFLVVKHRNHLAIMTSSAKSFSDLSTYDFTTSQTQAYGNNPMVELGVGIFGMASGDANSDGNITSTDFNIFSPSFNNISSGYLNSDFNLDLNVTSTDFNYFNPNFIRILSTQVPN
ncbi:MAG TPA: cohesin domain-containing protein [Ignavibacteriaceae bacterium]|nr:cohesin domain-containing protein [Ignavibacteriaceae bacterium]